MKNTVNIFILIAITAVLYISCGKQQAEKTAAATTKDSLLTKLQERDSSIMAYIGSINSIQKSIDTLMVDAKILKIHGEKAADLGTITAELKNIDDLILKNQKDLATLERRLKASNEKNEGLVDLGEHLSKELNEKDSEIAATQTLLAQTRESLHDIINQFNDSMEVIMRQRAQIGMMQVKGNTVFYIVGTEKDLKNDGVISKKGGVIGIGRVSVPKSDMNTTGFTSADLTNLHEIELGAHFVKMVTAHPERSYKITSGSPDKIVITDPQDFWSKSKYLVVIVK